MNQNLRNKTRKLHSLFALFALLAFPLIVSAQTATNTATETATVTETPTTTATRTATNTPTSTNTFAPTAVCNYSTTGAPFGTAKFVPKTLADANLHTLVDNVPGRRIQIESIEIYADAATVVTFTIGTQTLAPFSFNAAGDAFRNYGPQIPVCLGGGALTVQQSGTANIRLVVAYRVLG